MNQKFSLFPFGILFLFSGCAVEESTESRFSVMGTEAYVSAAANMIQPVMEKMDNLFSIYQDNSEISRVNRAAHRARFPVSVDTYRILEYAINYNKITDGAFDVTIAPLAQLWGFYGDPPPEAPLQPTLLEGTLQGLGIDKIQLYRDSVSLTTPFTQIDLGGIAIGYAVDKSIIAARSQGVSNVFVRLGQSARCWGVSRDIPIPDPRDPTNTIGTLTLNHSQAMSISRLTSHQIVIADKIYGHIIDPETGKPAETTLMATVMSPFATESDALSTALMVGDLEAAKGFLPEFPRSQVLIIPAKEPLEVWITPGFKEQFKPIESLSQSINLLEVAAKKN